MLGKIVIEGEKEESVPFLNPNNSNLVNEVSTKVNEKLSQTIIKGLYRLMLHSAYKCRS